VKVGIQKIRGAIAEGQGKMAWNELNNLLQSIAADKFRSSEQWMPQQKVDIQAGQQNALASTMLQGQQPIQQTKLTENKLNVKRKK
jgi:hypothetical protein